MVVLLELSHAREVEDLSLPAGTLSFGYFWTDRDYNAYHWISPQGATLGLYLNVSGSTAISENEVRWRDLVVDVLVTPDGRCRVLDEDELPDDLEPALLRRIKATRDDLVMRHRQLLEEVEARTRRFLTSIRESEQPGAAAERGRERRREPGESPRS